MSNYETNLTPAGPNSFVPELSQLMARSELPVNVIVSAMSWVQLVLVPDPPAKLSDPLGK